VYINVGDISNLGFYYNIFPFVIPAVSRLNHGLSLAAIPILRFSL